MYQNGLTSNRHKSEFHVHETIFLVHVINGQEVQIDSSKLETMIKYPIRIKKKQVPACLVFTNYYSRFIINYSTKSCPLINLTKDVPFTSGYKQQSGFYKLQARFLSAPILSQFHRTLNTIIETNTSNQAIPGILSQYLVINGYKQFHLVKYHAKTVSVMACQ